MKHDPTEQKIAAAFRAVTPDLKSALLSETGETKKGDTAMILSVEQQTYDLYMKYGYPKAAAAAYTISMYVYIDRKDFKKAHELMQLFESKSGLFDSKGNIKRGREHYYHCKGLYYLGINQLDSAEYYFKKQLPYGYSFDG